MLQGRRRQRLAVATARAAATIPGLVSAYRLRDRLPADQGSARLGPSDSSASTSAGPRSRPSSSMERQALPVAATDRSGPGRRPTRWPRRMREAAEQAGVETADLAGVGVGSPGDVDDEDRHRHRAPATCPAGRARFPLAETLEEALGAQVERRQRRPGRHRRRVRARRRRSRSARCSASSGAPASAAASSSTASPGSGRGAAGEIGHMVVKSDGAKCPCGRKGCMEAYAGRGAMEARGPRAARRGREDRALQDHGEARRATG